MTTAEKLQKAQQELQELESAYRSAIKAASWKTQDGQSSRSVQNVSVAVLADQISKKKAEIETLENIAAGRSGKAFRVGVRW